MKARSFFRGRARQAATTLVMMLVLLVPLTGSLQALQPDGQATATDASVIASVDQAGTLTLVGQAGSVMVVTCEQGQVRVNGAQPGDGATPCAHITSVVVNGSPERDQINLGGVNRAAFPRLSSVTVQGGGGDDVITASEFGDVLNGGPGDDAFVGVQPDDEVIPSSGQDFFVEAPLLTGPSPSAEAANTSPITSPDSPSPQAPGLTTSFGGPNFDTNGATTGFLFIPPDPIAVAGPNHVVTVVNVTIQWYTKAGVLQNSQSLANFFAPLTPLTYTFDPKVIYDQYEDRFVVITLEQTTSPNTSRILVAVSDDGNPNGTWYFQAINALVNIGGTDYWADYPGFSVDEEAVYITANLFDHATSTVYGGVRLWILDKKNPTGGLYAGGTSAVSVNDPYAAAGSPMTTQPAHIFGAAPPGVGTFLVSYSGLYIGVDEYAQVVRVDNPLTAPAFSQQYILLGNVENSLAAMPDAPQLGTATPIETNDRRALHAVWRNNFLWFTTQVVPKATHPDAGQTTAYWVQFDTTNLGALAPLDQGTVGGEDIAPSTFTFFPSIAVDPCNNVGIGFSASASSIYAGAYYTGRLATDPFGSVQPSGILAPGTDWYVRTFGSGRNRWGDYSGMSLDPANQATFWVFNEYAMQRGTATNPPPEDGRWATQFGAWPSGIDFGDLPAGYNRTTFSDDGARHSLGRLFMGSLIDPDADGLESVSADGDDVTISDDEDGVTSVAPWYRMRGGGEVKVTVGGANACLAAWIDWNGDNDFADSGEKILANEPVVPGSNSIKFNIPSSIPGGFAPSFFARFRLYPRDPGDVCTTARLLTGLVCDGEVEDYKFNITLTTPLHTYLPVVFKNY